MCVYGMGRSSGFGMGIERAGDLLGSEMLAEHRVEHHAAGQEGQAPLKPGGTLCWWVLLPAPLALQLLLALRCGTEGQRRAVSPCSRVLGYHGQIRRVFL